MWTKILLLFFVFSFLFKSDHSFDQDLGRHIKLGEVITSTWNIPKTNLFSYTNPDFHFINTHWFFGVLTFWFSQTIGLQTLLVLKIIIILLSVWLIIKTIPKDYQTLLLPIGFIFLHVLRERAELRPEIFSFLFTALTLFILSKYLGQKLHDRGKVVQNLWPVFLLPLIQLIWINTHIYFFIGLTLQTIYIIYIGYHQLRSHSKSLACRQAGGKLKILVVVFALSVIASLLNPNRLAGILYPLNVNKNYGYTIVENQTMFLLENIGFKNANFLFVKISIGVALLSIIIVILSEVKNLMIKKSRDPSLIAQDDRLKNILLSLSGMGLALMNVRSFPYLVFLSLPATLANFGPIKSKGLTKTVTIIFAGILLLESYFYLNGDYYRYRDDEREPTLKLMEHGRGALDFVIDRNLPSPIYNNFDIGSYIIYRGYPKYQVFVDGRPEAYPKQFFQDIYIPSQSDYSKFKDLEKNWQFKTILFSHTDQTPWAKTFLQELFKDQSWQLVYMDNVMIVLTKDEVVKEKNLALIDLSKLSPNQYNFSSHRDYLQIGLFLFSQNQASGKPFIERALQLFPSSPAANAIMAQITGEPAYQPKSKTKFFW